MPVERKETALDKKVTAIGKRETKLLKYSGLEPSSAREHLRLLRRLEFLLQELSGEIRGACDLITYEGRKTSPNFRNPALEQALATRTFIYQTWDTLVEVRNDPKPDPDDIQESFENAIEAWREADKSHSNEIVRLQIATFEMKANKYEKGLFNLVKVLFRLGRWCFEDIFSMAKLYCDLMNDEDHSRLIGQYGKELHEMVFDDDDSDVEELDGEELHGEELDGEDSPMCPSDR